jgi:hypothetical protein
MVLPGSASVMAEARTSTPSSEQTLAQKVEKTQVVSTIMQQRPYAILRMFASPFDNMLF